MAEILPTLSSFGLGGAKSFSCKPTLRLDLVELRFGWSFDNTIYKFTNEEITQLTFSHTHGHSLLYIKNMRPGLDNSWSSPQSLGLE